MALLRESAARASAILLIDTQMGPDDEAGKAKREETARLAEARGMSALEEAFLPRLLRTSAPAPLCEKVAAMIRSNPPAGSASALRGMALRTDSRDVLRAYAGPALVIVGEEDVITGPDKAKAMADALPSAQLVRVPDAGHLSNLEAPDVVNRSLAEFLAGVATA
jgi:pimeloyl-ACP methyl ester carboxylesterase